MPSYLGLEETATWGRPYVDTTSRRSARLGRYNLGGLLGGQPQLRQEAHQGGLGFFFRVVHVNLVWVKIRPPGRGLQSGPHQVGNYGSGSGSIRETAGFSPWLHLQIGQAPFSCSLFPPLFSQSLLFSCSSHFSLVPKTRFNSCFILRLKADQPSGVTHCSEVVV